MDKYEVIGLLGEGSFGRVYKAKQLQNGTFVALKVISKRGRSAKELKGFRRECEIQRELNHPNIIQMLDSFETENEIVVITEFAHKGLHVILGKKGYLSEEKVRPIVWDLVSALHYLHSHRVLHRDLKPQNILLDLKNHAKLCDFGFARNMSTGTHVLTSIKGTPLYMAPELIDEQPYDYNADLWSLGCIIYELLMGTPPFCTTSILHLIRLIRHEHIQWPTFCSEHCISFLKGLLQKNPTKRLKWDEILQHPFVEGHILIVKSDSSIPLTQPLAPDVQQEKEQQKKEFFNQKQPVRASASADKAKISNKEEKTSTSTQISTEDACNNNTTTSTELKTEENIKKSVEQLDKKISKLCLSEKLSFIEETHPLETEEWIVFLQRTIQEVMNGEMTSLTQPNLTNVIVSPLRNTNASSKVLSFAVRLLSIPFVIPNTSQDTLEQIQKVYSEVKLVPNLVYASKLLLRDKKDDSTSSSSASSPLPAALESYRRFNDLNQDDLQALHFIYLLITHLVHLDDKFLIQLCDSIVVLNVYVLFKMLLLLLKINLRIVLDVMAILTHIVRKYPENHELIEKMLLNESNNPDIRQICFVELLRHANPLLRERTCYFLLFSCKCLQENTVRVFWNEGVRETLEALMFDSIESVRMLQKLLWKN